MRKYRVEIKPAIEVSKRHRLEGFLKELGYHVSGGVLDNIFLNLKK